MPPGEGSDAFFSFGTDFPQVAQEIIDIARGLRGEIESTLGSGGAIGENMFSGLQAAATRASTESVNAVRNAKREIVEALSSGGALPAGGLFGALNAPQIGRELTASILEPLRQLPAQIQSEILPQVEAALGRLSSVQANLTSRVVTGATAEITAAAAAAGRSSELRGATGLPFGNTMSVPAAGSAAGGLVSGAATQELARYTQELNSELAKDVAAARQFAIDLKASGNVLNEELRRRLSGGELGGFGFDMRASGGRLGFVNPDTNVPTAFTNTGTLAPQQAGDAAWRSAQQQAARALEQVVTELRTTVGATATFDSRTEQAARMLPEYSQSIAQAAEATRRSAQLERARAEALLRASGAGGFGDEATGGGGRRAGGGGGGGGGLGGIPGAHAPQGPTDAFFGALFGQGWHAMQGFNPNMAAANLAGTAGVLLRYGGEARVLFGAIGQVKEAFQGFEQYQSSMIQLSTALEATHQHQVDLNGAIDAGAQSGVDSATSIAIGANALSAYSTYIQQGANATDIFTESVKQAGIAAVLTGEDAKQASQELIAATIGFNLGPQGQARISDAVESARRNYGGDAQSIQQAVSQAAPEAYLQGMSPEELANMAALIQRSTPGASGSTVASLMSKLIVRGQNEQFTGAIMGANERGAGINLNADFATQVESLSRYFNSLNESSQKAFITQLGGARAIGALLPLLREGTSLLDNNAKSMVGGGSAAQEYYKHISTVGGQLRQLATLMKNISTDVGRSGIFLPLGAGIELLKPGLQLLDDILKKFDSAPGHIGQFVVALAEVYGLYRLINSEAVKTIFGRGVANVQTRVANVTGAGGAAAAGAGAATKEAEAAATDKEAASEAEAAAAKAANERATLTLQVTEARSTQEREAAYARLQAYNEGLLANAAAQEEAARAAELQAQATKAQETFTAQLVVEMRAAGEAALAEAAAYRELALAQEEAGQAAMFPATMAPRGGPIIGEQSRMPLEVVGPVRNEFVGGAGAAASETILPELTRAQGRAAFLSRTLESVPGMAMLQSAGGRAAEAAAPLLSRGGAMLGNLKNVAMTPQGMLGIFAALEFDKALYHTVSSIDKASDKSDSAQLQAATAQTVDDLNASASNLGQAAQGLRHASGGFFGATLNWLMGDPTGHQAREDTSMAAAAANAAKALQAAADRSGVQGQAALINLGSAKEFQNSVKWLQDNGRDAGTQLAAASSAMGAAAANMSGQGIPGMILPGAVPVAAAHMADMIGRQNVLNVAGSLNTRAVGSSQSQQISDLLTANLGTGLGEQLSATFLDVSERIGRVVSHGIGENIIHTITLGHVGHYESPFTELFGHGQNEESVKNSAAEKQANQLKNLVGSGQFKDFTSKTLSPALEQDLKNEGYDGGGQVTPAEVARLRKIAEDKIRNAPWFKDLPKNVQDALVKGADDAVDKFATSTDLSTATVTPETVSAYTQWVMQNAPTAGNEAGVRAALGGSGPQGIVTAQETLRQLQIGYNKAAAVPGVAPERLQQIQDAIDAQTLALQQAVTTHIGVQGALTASQFSPHDRIGGIQRQIGTLTQQLQNSTDPDVIAQYQTQLNQLMYASMDQQTADANAVIAANADPLSQLSEAQAAVGQAVNNLNNLINQGVTSGADYGAAVKAVRDTKAAALKAQVADLNAYIESTNSYGDTSQADINKARELERQAAITDDPGARAQLLTQARNSRIEAQIAADNVTRQALIAGQDPRNTIAIAQINLQQDRQLLRDTPRSSDQYAQLQAKIRQDKIDLRNDVTALANARIEAGTFPGSQIDQARAKVREATNTLRNDLPGTAQYFTDLAALHSAQIDFANALVGARDVARQLTIDMTNPVAVAIDAVTKAKDQLNTDLKNRAPTDIINQDVLNVQQAQNNAQRTAFEQQMSDAKLNADLGRTSYGAYLQYLENQHNYLTSIRHRTRQQQDELNEVDQAIKEAAAAAGGQFNLGDIKVPTDYQARRQMAAGGTVLDYNPIATGGQFGVGGSQPGAGAPTGTGVTAAGGTAIGGSATPVTLAQTATSTLDPVKTAIVGLSPAAHAAATSVRTLTTDLKAMSTQLNAASHTVNHLTINGTDFSKVVAYLDSILGPRATKSRAPVASRKGG